MPEWSASVRVCFQANRRGAQKSLAALQDRAMVKRTVPIRVISLILLSACGAFSQKRPSTGLLEGVQFDGSHSPECSTRRCVNGDHFLMLRRRYSHQRKQRDFTRSSIMKQVRL